MKSQLNNLVKIKLVGKQNQVWLPLGNSLLAPPSQKGRFPLLLLQNLKVSNHVAKQAFFDKEEHLSMGFADSI